MDEWGPYLAERILGSIDDSSANCKEAFSSRKFRDGIFGLCNATGTVTTSFAFWNGHDSHLKERLVDDSEIYQHGLTDPQYRYCSCRYIYPQTTLPSVHRRTTKSQDPTFDVHFELAKDQQERLFYRLTVTNCASGPGSPAAAELTVAAQLWVCHANCGRIEQGLGANYLRVSAADTCCHQSCKKTDDIGQATHCGAHNTVSYKLHYQPDALESVAFSNADNPDAFSQLIVSGDRSLLCADSVGCRAAVIYRLSVPAAASVIMSFLLTAEASGTNESLCSPDWSTVPSLMQWSAGLATELLSAASSDQLPDAAKRIARRAYSSILWNRQLCSVNGHSGPCLVVVPDKWHRPLVASWEHGLHAIVLCQVSRDLAVAELRNQLARLSISGEMPGTIPAPPVWPLALLEIVRIHNDKEIAESIFMEILHHLNWWLLDRKDESGMSTMEGGILGLDHNGWIETTTHASETNDSLVWSGLLCSKMVQIAALLQLKELKTLLDLFNAAASSLHNDTAFVGGLFMPRWAGEKPGGTREVSCGCAFGLVPLFGCASIAWDHITDHESRVFIEWLQWLSSETVASETPTLFVKTESKSNRFLISWLTESEFVQTCATLFDPHHFLSQFGIRCASKSQGEKHKPHADGSFCRVAGDDVVSIPLNYLTLDALKCWESVYGQQLQLEYPTGSGVRASLHEIVVDISQRVLNIFLMIDDDAPMFYEFYEAESGKGIGHCHTSWSSLVANIAQNLVQQPTLALHVAPTMPRSVGRILPKNSVLHTARQSLRNSFKLDDFAPEANFNWSVDP